MTNFLTLECQTRIALVQALNLGYEIIKMKRQAHPPLSFQQKLMRELRLVPLLPKRILLCVSGGVDSMVLLEAMNEVSPLFGFCLVVGHVHHGRGGGSEQRDFRLRAQNLVEKRSYDLGLQFVSNQPEDLSLSSEASLRSYRYGWLEKWKHEFQCEALGLGHQFEDLLETQVMRLLRGSSRLGLGAMTVLNPHGRFRPFLNFKKQEIQNYARIRQVPWLEDPSNRSLGPLRNWLRQWLGEVEAHWPGAQENLSKSLQRLVVLAQENKSPWKDQVLTEGGISRSLYLSLSRPHKAELLADYLRRKGVFHYTSGQIYELIKRLDGSSKSHRFVFLKKHWALDPEWIQISSDN